MHLFLKVLYAAPATQEFDTENYAGKTSCKLLMELGIRQVFPFLEEVHSEVLIGSTTYLSLGMGGTLLMECKVHRSKDEIRLPCICAIY